MKHAILAGALALPWISLAQVAGLEIRITEGEGAVHAAGGRSARPLSVQITDENGRPVWGAAVSFRLPQEGPGGVSPSGLLTELVISDARGRAALRNLQLNRTPGPFQIRITASRDQARAGTVSQQFIRAGAAPAGFRATRKAGRKWIAVALASAGAAGGLAAGMAGRAAPAPAPKPAAATAPPVTIGPPVITVGRP